MSALDPRESLWLAPGGAAGVGVAAQPAPAGPSAAVRRVAVIGAGTMGNGIAQAFATSGFEVELVDVNADFVSRALGTIGRSLERVAKKQEWPAGRAAEVLKRIRGGSALDAARECEIAIEAVSEDFGLKQKVFAQLDAAARPGAVLATNTSSISITEVAATTKRADRVIGMHFMNPVPVMPLVEIIRGLQTSDATCALVSDLAKRLGKTPVEVNDFPGFVSNRVLMPMINEAIFCLQDGVAEAAAIDEIMKLGMNHPMGPLALGDLIGLDVCLFILEVLHRDLGEDRYRPCPLLRKMVAAGRLGRKTKQGFYHYE